MKKQIKILAIGCLVSASVCSTFAQGNLTPPGAPAPTMKSLDQIETRTPISALPYTIDIPGSYYITTKLQVAVNSGIVIRANNVTLDLNGFTISSIQNPASTGVAIQVGTTGSGAVKNVTILNGFISSGVTNNNGTFAGNGFGYGIYNLALPSRNVHVSGVTVTGCRYTGIFLGTAANNTLVESCIVDTAGSYGIYAGVVRDSSVFNCGGTGINADQIVNCRCDSPNASYALYGRSVYNSVGTSTNGYGIYSSGVVQNSVGESRATYGLYASYSAENCYGFSNPGNGLYAATAQNCYGNSPANTGLTAMTAQNCYGSSIGGLRLSTDTAQSCYGYGNTSGLAANVAIGCYGYSDSGSAVKAANASFCTGYGHDGTAFQSTIATGCYTAFGTNNITYKYNMP